MSRPADDDGNWLTRHREALRAATRATVAGLLSYVAAVALDLFQPFWAVMSALFVIQSTFGASLKASLDRLAGTLGGVIWGGIVATLIPWDGPSGTFVTLAAALVPLTLIAAMNGRYHVAPVAAVITVILPRDTHMPELDFAIARTAEAGVGGVVAVVVALLVLPSRGRRLLETAAANVLRTIANILAAGAPLADPAAVRAAIDRGMADVDAAATEARRERRLRISDDPDPEPLVIFLGRVRNDVVMVLRAAAEPFAEPLRERLDPLVAAIIAAAGTYLQSLADTLDADGPLPDDATLRAAFAAYPDAVDAIRAEGLTHGLAVHAVEPVFSLGFALAELDADLTALAGYCAPYLSSPPAPGAPTSAA